MNTHNYFCPCCGYSGLTKPAYERLKIPVPDSVIPPYEQWYGLPSYDVCDCCGFEFGNDDNPGTGKPITFREYLSNWIKEDALWFVSSKRPNNWTINHQLIKAGLNPIDKYINE